MDELGDLFAQDAVWEGKGRYEEAFGRHEGRDAILAMLGSYATSGHFILNAHYLTSEDIVILDDRTAMASWQMLQVSTYHDGKSDFRSASLNLEFAVRDGSWRITRFVTQAIFSRAVGPWNDDTAISVPTASTITLENEDTEK
ncbi:nuclear transport factor 2 family protein [Novosphingobium olei]|nr:nuclear transport factor 2 family protein [Novosphingobium olei]